MHDYYREKGVPENVELITAEISDLSFDTDFLDTAVSTMAYHEFASSDALHELSRVVSSGGRLAIADWTADGHGEAGSPLDERFTVEDAASSFRDHGFTIRQEVTRAETFVLVGTRE